MSYSTIYSTQLVLFKDCPLTPDYVDTIYFDTPSDQYDYFFSINEYGQGIYLDQRVFNNLSYQRINEGTIRVKCDYVASEDSALSGDPEDLRYYNYLSFVNDNMGVYDSHHRKRQFAFILDVTYINEHTAEIHYQIDVMQTWFFNHKLLPSFVERETCAEEPVRIYKNDDGVPDAAGIVGNFVPENLPALGYDYTPIRKDRIEIIGVDKEVYTSGLYFNRGNSSTYREDIILIGAIKINPLTGVVIENPDVFLFENGLYSCCTAYIFRQNNELIVEHVLNQISGDPETQNLFVGAYQVPAGFFSENSDFSDGVRDVHIAIDKAYDTNYGVITNSNGDIESYEPKNAILYAYPYTYMVALTSDGSEIEFRLEEFFTEIGNQLETEDAGALRTIGFTCYTSASPYPEMLFVPKYYNSTSLEFKGIQIPIKDFPQIGLASDGYAAWLAMNKNTLEAQEQANRATTGARARSSFYQTISDDIGTLQSVDSVDGLLDAVPGLMRSTLQDWSRLSNIKNEYRVNEIMRNASIEDAENLPNTIKMNATSGLKRVARALGLGLHIKRVKPRYVKMLDDYFTQYGYKVSRIKQPNRKVRSGWTYVQTVGCKIAPNSTEGYGSTVNGFPPANVALKIQEIYNRGITFWTSSFVKAYKDVGDRTGVNEFIDRGEWDGE